MDEIFTPGQVEAVLNEIGVDVRGETDTNLLCLCPFHKNTDSPSFSVAKDTGLYLCFSPICDERGTLSKLVSAMTRSNPFVVKRIIKKHDCVVTKQDLQLFCMMEIGIPGSNLELGLLQLRNLKSMELSAI